MAISTLEKPDQLDQSPEVAKEKPKLSESQMEFIDDKFEDAVKKGVLRREDRMKLYARLTKLTPSQIENAEDLVKEYIEKKTEKRDDYIKELDNAVLDGLISVYDHKRYLANYDKMSGKERQKEADDGWPKRLEQKKLEKKEFKTLVEESPHFFHEGKITPEGQALLDEYNAETRSERHKLLLKRRLIQKIEKFDYFSNLCKKRYNIANAHYQRGEYQSSVELMKKNQRTCERYPESARLKEFADFAQWDSNNGDYERIQDLRFQNKRAEVQECFKGKDPDNGLVCAQEAVQMMQDIIATTYDGRLGPYQEGSSTTKPRSEKWVSPYMKRQLQKVQQEQDMAQKSYDAFYKKQQEDEERFLAGQTEELDQEESEDFRTQALIKGATDSLDSLHETEEPVEQAEQDQPLQQAAAQTGESLSAHQPTTSQAVDMQEEQEVEHIFDEGAGESEEDWAQEEAEAQQQETTAQEAQQQSTEELENKEVVIDEQEQGRLQQRDAEQLLQAKAKLKIQRKGQELDTEQKVKDHLSEELSQSRQDRIKQRLKSGEINNEQAEILMQEAQQMEQGGGVGQEVLDSHRKQGQVVQFQSQETTKRNITDTFRKSRNERATTQKIRQNNAKNKAAQLEQAKR